MLVGSAKGPSGTYLYNQPEGLLIQTGSVEVCVSWLSNKQRFGGFDEELHS